MKTLKPLLAIIVLSLFFTQLSSQAIIRQSINSIGSSSHIDGGLVSESVGQVYFTKGYSEPDLQVNPGFQQRMISFYKGREINGQLQIQLYPNPVSDELYLVSAETIKDARIELLDISGKVILLAEENIESELILSLGHFSDGLYNIRVTDKQKGKSFNSRIIIIK